MCIHKLLVTFLMLKDCSLFYSFFTFLFVIEQLFIVPISVHLPSKTDGLEFQHKRNSQWNQENLEVNKNCRTNSSLLTLCSEIHSFVSSKISVSTQICNGSTAKYVILLLTHSILRKEMSTDILNMSQIPFDLYADLCFSFSSSLSHFLNNSLVVKLGVW